MTPRERVIRTLNHKPIDRAPRDLWTLPCIETRRADELAELLHRFPLDIEKPDFKYPSGHRASGRPDEAGHYTDAWGCTWQVVEPDATAAVCLSPLTAIADIGRYQPPLELIEAFDVDRVNRGCAASNRFVLAWTEVRPFDRLRFLRGTEAAYIDLAHGSRHVRGLLTMLHEFACRELEAWATSDVDGVAFRDDWGSQSDLLVSPDLWREVFKPLYRDYCRVLHAHDKFAFFHSDGNISEIFGDLVEIGVDAIHCQLFCMDVERLARNYRGRITFWGEIDRHRTLPLGDSRAVRLAVQRVRAALDYGAGGVIAQCQWGTHVSFKNVAAVYDEWLRPLPMHIAAKSSA